MFPLSETYEFSINTQYVLAFFIGIFFGVFLEQGGFGNAKKLARTFYLRDMTVVKVMFTAIITAMSGIIILSHFEVLDMSSAWINPSYITPGIVGGLVMGVGFAVGGYCPGTGIVGASTLKVDAFFNILGGFVGMFVFGETIPYFIKFYNSGLVGLRTTIPEWLGFAPGIVGGLVIFIALCAFIASEFAEKKFSDGEDL